MVNWLSFSLTDRQIFLGFLLFVIPAWVFGGWGLMYVGGRFLARAPKTTCLRSLAAHVGSLPLATFTLGLCMWRLTPGVQFPAYAQIVLLVLVPVGLLVAWWVISRVLQISFRTSRLAWLPQMLIVLPLLVLVLWPVTLPPRLPPPEARCMRNLKNVGMAIHIYRQEHGGRTPADFSALIQDGLPPRMSRCPAASPVGDPNDETYDYFYLPASRNAPSGRMIVCDFRGNHGSATRNVLYADMSVRKLSEEEFQRELTRPVNAEFAKALREVEGQ